jgi:SAM-dependent methyltransferase
MKSDEGEFWDQRYRAEGAIWGDGPSPTAELAARYLHASDRVLEVGFGYGRDLAFLSRQRCKVFGMELSREGHRLARDRLLREGLRPEELVLGKFEDSSLPLGSFDAILSHRMLHLLVSREAIAGFARKAAELLRPGGLLCLGARNPHDLDPAGMVRIEDNVYEYVQRPGHRIRYWDNAAFREVFGEAFTVLALSPAVEQESTSRPVPCHLTLMAGRKKPCNGTGNGACGA